MKSMTFLCVLILYKYSNVYFFEQILKIARFERKFSGNQQKYGAELFEQYKKTLARTEQQLCSKC